MWFFLNNKALTWDKHQKKGKLGPGVCTLCNSNEETNYHLRMECSFTEQVWKEIQALLK